MSSSPHMANSPKRQSSGNWSHESPELDPVMPAGSTNYSDDENDFESTPAAKTNATCKSQYCLCTKYYPHLYQSNKCRECFHDKSQHEIGEKEAEVIKKIENNTATKLSKFESMREELERMRSDLVKAKQNAEELAHALQSKEDQVQYLTQAQEVKEERLRDMKVQVRQLDKLLGQTETSKNRPPVLFQVAQSTLAKKGAKTPRSTKLATAKNRKSGLDAATLQALNDSMKADSEEVQTPRESEEIEMPSRASFTSVADVAVASSMNKRESMQDSYVVIDGYGGVPNQGFFAVYDGHGGIQAASFAAVSLHNLYLEKLQPDENGGEPKPPHEIFKDVYTEVDGCMRQMGLLEDGCTATTVFVRKGKKRTMLYIANVGDTEAVLSRDGNAARISYNHRPSDSREQERVKTIGGKLSQGKSGGSSKTRVGAAGMSLAVTRTLGDRLFKQVNPAVICEPFVEAIELPPEGNNLLIIACDGLWDVVSVQEAVNIAKDLSSCQEMVDTLMNVAMKRGSKDNITVIAAQL